MSFFKLQEIFLVDHANGDIVPLQGRRGVDPGHPFLKPSASPGGTSQLANPLITPKLKSVSCGGKRCAAFGSVSQRCACAR